MKKQDSIFIPIIISLSIIIPIVVALLMLFPDYSLRSMERITLLELRIRGLFALCLGLLLYSIY